MRCGYSSPLDVRADLCRVAPCCSPPCPATAIVYEAPDDGVAETLAHDEPTQSLPPSSLSAPTLSNGRAERSNGIPVLVVRRYSALSTRQASAVPPAEILVGSAATPWQPTARANSALRLSAASAPRRGNLRVLHRLEAGSEANEAGTQPALPIGYVHDYAPAAFTH